ncbi:Ig-like domain-containing protein [Beduini massiliensis]|uniref:Ig-like domain-containing protein n=1 Tax=Beduini massiliensis TaxID=1585974 RepID=UPI0006937E68|nr:Ig-like domain-containing protein [Beduini massiliensis]
MTFKNHSLDLFKKLFIISLTVLMIGNLVHIEAKADTTKNAGGFMVTGGVEGVDYEYGDVVYHTQGYGNAESTSAAQPSTYGGVNNITVKALTIKTNTPLTISTNGAVVSDCIYIQPGNDADITLNNVKITGILPINIPTNIDHPTSAHITIADGSENVLTTNLSATQHFPGIRCGEGSSLTIDDARRNVDINGVPILPEGGRISRDATLQDGTIVHQGDRLTLLDSPNAGTLKVNGGYRAAAIGGAAIENSGNMTFNGGKIIATAYGPGEGGNGAGTGIGGGHAGGGTVTTFNGGIIEAYGSYHGAGIGGGCTYVGGMSTSTVTYTLTDIIMCETPKSTIAGDININGGFLKSTGYTHSNAFGQGCGGTNTGKTITITGGTLLPSSQSGWYDIGGAGGDVIVTGGSIRLSGTGKFQSKEGDGSAWGDLEKTTKVFMTKIDLKGYNIPITLVDDMKMTINGLESDYGMPSYTDEQGALYFWLPNRNTPTEVRVDLSIKDSGGEEIPMDSFFVTDATNGSILKQYVSFSVDNTTIPDEKRLHKTYDGLAFDGTQQQDFLNLITAGGIPVTIPSGKVLDDASKMTIQSQLLDNDTLEPSTEGEIISGMQANVGKYQLIITSSQYASDPTFQNSFWGHRGYYKYAQIDPADSQIAITAKRADDKTGADNKITITANVSPDNKEAKTCKAPTGLVQFYINGKPYGDPVAVTAAADKNSDNYEYSQATIEWTPSDDGGKNTIDGTQTITAKYIGGTGTNYNESTGDPVELEVTPVDQGDETIGGNPIIITDKTDDTVIVPGSELDKIYGDQFQLELEGGDTDEAPIYSSSDESIAIVDEYGNVTIVGVGEVTITVTRPGNGAYNDATQEIVINAGKRKVEPEFIDILDKYYDGKVDASVDLETIRLKGVLDSDLENFLKELKITAVFPNENVGNYNDAEATLKLSKELSKKYYFEDEEGYRTSEYTLKDEASILPRPFDDENIQVAINVNDIPDQPYTGKPILPPVIVKDGDKVLVEGVDYTVEYKNNIEVGSATAIIKGKGNYASSLDTTFEITTVNMDTNGDGKPDVNVDTNGDGKPDINIDTNGDGKPDINIDTNGDGKPDINIDTNGDGKPDINIDTNGDGKPDINIDTNGDGKPDINIDTNGDGKPDINIDTNGDGKPDINIDTNGDGKPDINIDTNGDGKPDINIDTDGDGKPDINIDTNGDGKPDINIDTNGDGKADLNIDVDGDGIPDYNIDTDGDGIADQNLIDQEVVTIIEKMVDTGDHRSLMTLIMGMLLSLAVIVASLIKKKTRME